MKDALQELVDKYPRLTEKCPYLSVGPGWAELLDELFSKIDKDGVYLAQCKEKFAALRVYLDISDSFTEEESKYIYDTIREYENKSIKTCEECSKPGKQSGKGWIKTLCESCANSRK